MSDDTPTTPPPPPGPPPGPETAGTPPPQADAGAGAAAGATAAQAQEQAKAIAANVMGDSTLKIAAGGLLAVFIGLILPWAKVSAGPFSATSSGFSTGDGKLVFILAIVAVVGLYLRKWIVGLAAAAIAALLTLYDIIDIGRLGGDVPGEAKSLIDAGTGIGIWLTLLGAIALVVAAYLQRNESQ